MCSIYVTIWLHCSTDRTLQIFFHWGGGRPSSAWSGACILVPLELYRSFGNISILADNLEIMRLWINGVIQKCMEKPENLSDCTPYEKKWNEYLFNTGFHF